MCAENSLHTSEHHAAEAQQNESEENDHRERRAEQGGNSVSTSRRKRSNVKCSYIKVKSYERIECTGRSVVAAIRNLANSLSSNWVCQLNNYMARKLRLSMMQICRDWIFLNNFLHILRIYCIYKIFSIINWYSTQCTQCQLTLHKLKTLFTTHTHSRFYCTHTAFIMSKANHHFIVYKKITAKAEFCHLYSGP